MMEQEKIVRNILNANLDMLKEISSIKIDEKYIESYKLKDPKIKKDKVLKLIDIVVTSHFDNKSKRSPKAPTKKLIDTFYSKQS